MHKTGVSIIVFVEDEQRSFKHYQLVEAAEKVEALFQEKVDPQLLARYSMRLEGIKANGIDAEWRRQYMSLNSLCCLANDTDEYGQQIWYFVMVDVEQVELFQLKNKKDIINLTKHGHVLWSSLHFPPGFATQKKLLGDYTFYNTKQE